MSIQRKNRLEEGRGESLIEAEPNKYVRCNEPGRRRIHHGLDAGIHCNECYEKLVQEYSQRSW
jgi:hypothetical protein